MAALRVAGAQPARVHAEVGDVPRLLGCYALFDSSGAPALGRIPGAPAVVRLDTVTAVAPAAPAPPLQLPAGTAPRLRRVAMSTDAIRSARELAAARALWAHNRWAVRPRSDSLDVAFTTRFTGTVFVFGLPTRGAGWVAVGDRLAGRAIEYRDSGPPFRIDYGGATAVRVTCAPLGAASARAGVAAPPPNDASQ